MRSLLNSTQLLFDLQQVNEIGRSISGCLDPIAIAQQVTEALVQRFHSAFARIWLTEPDQSSLRLVASSGLYTHTNGSFARVPMGAYKVGKIAQNRVPFLSNHLANETWVKDRDWAIANRIQGFAGYPLIAGDRVLGVLATFSHDGMAPEFLEVLQVLCLTITIALDAALQIQQHPPQTAIALPTATLSDQLALVLPHTRLMLVGTERPLPPAMAYLMVRSAELLHQCHCRYCRLTYGADAITLAAIAVQADPPVEAAQTWGRSPWEDLRIITTWLGGTLQTQGDSPTGMVEFLLRLPYPTSPAGVAVAVRSQSAVVRTVMTHLCCQAGFQLCDASHPEAIWLTDEVPEPAPANPLIWIRHRQRYPAPPKAKAVIDLWVEPAALHHLVTQIAQGQTGEPLPGDAQQRLSDREQNVMLLLAQGLRDRDIAQHLHISESTVKFHINNTLTKLNAKNRYQAVYEATLRHWI